MFVSFGADAANEPAAEQTLPGFNQVSEAPDWRLRDDLSFAIIQRWFIDPADGWEAEQFIAVSQLVPGATCHIAWVDVRADADANVLARQAADGLAGPHDCRLEPQRPGRLRP